MPLSYLLILLAIVITLSGLTLIIGYSAGVWFAVPVLIAAAALRLWGLRK